MLCQCSIAVYLYKLVRHSYSWIEYTCWAVPWLVVHEIGFNRVNERSTRTNCNWAFQPRRPSSTVGLKHYIMGERWFTWAWIWWDQRGFIRGGGWCHTGVKSTKLEHGACPSLSSVVRKPPCGHRTPYPINLYCGLQHSPSMEPSDGSDLTTTHTPISNYQSISTTHISQFTVTKTLYYNTCITSLATSWHITEMGEN